MDLVKITTRPGSGETNSDNEVLILLDTDLRPELKHEGVARDLINRVQRLRKKAGLVPTDAVCVEYRVLQNPNDIDIGGIMKTQQAMIEKALRSGLQEQKAKPAEDHPKAQDDVILEEERVIQEATLLLRLLKL